MRSSDGLRLARHAKRQQGVFVALSDDPVVQFLAEEALMERLEGEDRKLEEAAALERAVADAERRVSDDLKGLTLQ